MNQQPETQQSWQEQSERGSPWALKAILWLALNAPRWLPRLLLWPITLYFLLMAGNARRAAYRYQQRLHQQDMAPSPNLWRVARHIHCFAATILDRVDFLTGRLQSYQIELHGTEAVTEPMAQQQGGLLLGAHLGSFDALRGLAKQHGELPVRVLMYPQHNALITGLLQQLDPQIAERIIPIGGVDTLLRVQETLQQGEWVGLLGDRVAESDKTLRCRFLGGEVDFPAGPAMMALALKAPVVLVLGLRLAAGHYAVYCETLPGLEAVARSERHQALQQWTQHYAERLEHYVCLAPDNWFNFYDYWQEAQDAH